MRSTRCGRGPQPGCRRLLHQPL